MPGCAPALSAYPYIDFRDPAAAWFRNATAFLITRSSTIRSFDSLAACSAWTCHPTIDVSPLAAAA